jgi:hypothetical protein
MRHAFVILLIALCVLTSCRVSTASPRRLSEPDRPVLRKVVPISLRYRQQIDQQIHLPTQQPSGALSVETSVSAIPAADVEESAVLPNGDNLGSPLIPLRL